MRAFSAERLGAVEIERRDARNGGRSDPDIVGRTITINQTGYVIVGVAPEGFRGHIGGLDNAYYQLWLPLSRHPRLQPDSTSADSARFARDAAWVRVAARLPEGTTVSQSDAMVQSVMAALAARHPATNGEKAGGVEPYFPPGARLRAQVSFARLMMLGLAGIVLLVVGLNISGMMLVRSAMRQRELAVRVAMGASRWRLMRQHLGEIADATPLPQHAVVDLLGFAFCSLGRDHLHPCHRPPPAMICRRQSTPQGCHARNAGDTVLKT